MNYLVDSFAMYLCSFQKVNKKNLTFCQTSATVNMHLTLWRLAGFGDFRKKRAVFGCLTNALAPPPIALESCSTAQTDRPV